MPFWVHALIYGYVVIVGWLMFGVSAGIWR